MNIQIGKQITSVSRYINCYVVEINTMYGDGDNYGKIEVGGFSKGKDEDILKDLLDTLKRMKEEAKRADDYYDIDGFNKWFNLDYLEDLDEEEREELYEYERVYSIAIDWDKYKGDYYKYLEHSIFYYDENGLKYEAFINNN